MDENNQDNITNPQENKEGNEEDFKDDFDDYEELEEKPLPTIYSEVTREAREILRKYDVGNRSERSVKVICRWLIQTEQQSLHHEKKLLSTLPPKDLEDVAQNIIYQEYSPKELIFLQGEIGTCYYIIFSGSVNIVLCDLKNIDMDLHKEYVDEKFQLEHEGFAKLQNNPISEKGKMLGSSMNLPKILESLIQGKYFGELCLMMKEPVRTATAISNEYSELLSIHKNYFDKYILMNHFLCDDFEDQMKFLQSVDIFSDWNISRTSSVVYWCKCCNYRNSTIIHKEGDKIEGIDFIYEGMVKLLINNPNNNKSIELSIYPRGTFYGEELYSLKEDKYEYSVVACSPVRILRLYERDFARFTKLCKSTECIKKLNKICKIKKDFLESRLNEFRNSLPLLSMKPLSPLSTIIDNNNNNNNKSDSISGLSSSINNRNKNLQFSPIKTKQQQLQSQSQQQNPFLIPVGSIQNVYKRSDRVLEENIMKTCPTYNVKGSYWRIQESPFVKKSKTNKIESKSSHKNKHNKKNGSVYSAYEIKKQIDSCEMSEVPLYCRRNKKKKLPFL